MRQHTAKFKGDVELWQGDNDRMYLKVKDEQGNSVLVYLSAKIQASSEAKQMWEANFEGEK